MTVPLSDLSLSSFRGLAQMCCIAGTLIIIRSQISIVEPSLLGASHIPVLKKTDKISGENENKLYPFCKTSM